GSAAARGEGTPPRADRRRDRPRRVRGSVDGGRRRALLGVRRFSLPRAVSRREGSARFRTVAEMARRRAAVGDAPTIPLESGQARHEICRSSVYPSIPNRPPSRPAPLSLKPPHGLVSRWI